MSYRTTQKFNVFLRMQLLPFWYIIVSCSTSYTRSMSSPPSPPKGFFWDCSFREAARPDTDTPVPVPAPVPSSPRPSTPSPPPLQETTVRLWTRFLSANLAVHHRLRGRWLGLGCHYSLPSTAGRRWLRLGCHHRLASTTGRGRNLVGDNHGGKRRRGEVRSRCGGQWDGLEGHIRLLAYT